MPLEALNQILPLLKGPVALALLVTHTMIALCNSLAPNLFDYLKERQWLQASILLALLRDPYEPLEITRNATTMRILYSNPTSTSVDGDPAATGEQPRQAPPVHDAPITPTDRPHRRAGIRRTYHPRHRPRHRP